VRPVPRDLYPFEGRYETVNGHRMHLLDEGEGPPVVMVHGNPTWSFYYRNLVLALRDTHRCIVPDHIGCGMSDVPDDDTYDYHFQRRADDLEALLDQIGVEGPVTLVLHDWGGMIGMDWADRHPDRVARLVLLNTAAFHLPSTKPMPKRLSIVRDSSVGAFLVRGFNAFSGSATWMAMARTKMPKRVRDAYTAPYDTWHNRIATLRFVQDIPLSEADRGFDRISAVSENLPQFDDRPVFIGWGLKDFVFDKHFLAVWEQKLPSAEVVRYEDAGHYVLEDVGAELIERIVGFLGAHPVDGAAGAAE